MPITCSISVRWTYFIIGESIIFQLQSNYSMDNAIHQQWSVSFILTNAACKDRSITQHITQRFISILLSKIVSMIRKYHNHKPQTTPWHREEEPPNHHETPGRQVNQSNQLSLPHQDDCNTRMDIK